MHPLIKDFIDERTTVLMHGTSVEAVKELIKTGWFLPLPELCLDTRRTKHKGHETSLYFVPNATLMSGWWYYDLIRALSFKDALSYVKSCAYSVQERFSLIERFGFFPQTIYNSDIYNVVHSKKEMKQLSQETDTAIPELRTFLGNLNKKKGVLLGFGINIFEYDISPSPTDADKSLEVLISLPEGISIKYMNAIVPLGDYEREALANIWLL